MSSLRRIAWSGLALVALVINPNLGCSALGLDDFDYGEKEMRANIEGRWRVEGTLAGAPVSFTMSIVQATTADVPQASAITTFCGSRTFVREAGACLTTSNMPVKVTVVEGAAPWAGLTAVGNFTMSEHNTGGGHLSVRLGDHFDLRGPVQAGKATMTSVRDGAEIGQVTLERLTPTP